MGDEPRDWNDFRDSAGTPRPFRGWLLAEESTAHPRSVRWTEMSVYLTTDDKYVVYVCGCSVVYHRPDSGCNTGNPVHAADMEEDLDPCRYCRPGPYLTAPDNAEFDVEVNLPSL